MQTGEKKLAQINIFALNKHRLDAPSTVRLRGDCKQPKLQPG